METDQNLKKVALVFFIILGLGHIFSALMISNNYFLPASLVIHHILEIPFAISGLIYAFATIYSNIDPTKRKGIANIFIFITFAVFLGLLYINTFIPNRV